MRCSPLVNLALLLVVAGCGKQIRGNAAPTTSVESNVLPYPGVDPSLGENLFPDEKSLSVQIADAIEGSIRDKYRAGNARRDAHAKSHGCVRAEFHVNEALPVSLMKGIFIPGKTYQRLSAAKFPTR
ncbi:hypothetical protein [Cupriavidus sp. 8B]